MENESKNNEVVKLSKRDVFYILLSFLLWGVWIAMIGFLSGVGSAIGIFGQGLMLLLSGIMIGRYRERRETAGKEQEKAKNQQYVIEE